MNDEALQRLRQQGHRLTPQRRVILAVLQEAGGHLSPGEVFSRARSRLPGLTEATVYRTLDFLTRQGMLLAAHVGGGRLVYELADRQHHHLICRACGRTVEIAHEALAALYARFEAQTGFLIDSSHLTFFGLCPQCRQEEER